MTHTPGPWTAKEVMHKEEVAEAIMDGAEAEAGWWITGPAFIDCEDSGLFFREADARLIAAAPLLLSVAQFIRERSEEFEPGYPELTALVDEALAGIQPIPERGSR